MKKKIIILCLVMALAATAVVGGTLAYFTDTADAIPNVVTLGNIEIVLTEEFDNTQILVPAVDGDQDNYLWKVGMIENTGNIDAYVRLVVAIQHSASTENKGGLAANTSVYYDSAVFYEWFNTEVDHIQLADGNWYSIITFTGKEALAPGEQIETMNALRLMETVTLEDLEGWGITGTMNILFSAQAVQVDSITAENADADGTNGAQSNIDEILDLALGDVSTYTTDQLNSLFGLN